MAFDQSLMGRNFPGRVPVRRDRFLHALDGSAIFRCWLAAAGKFSAGISGAAMAPSRAGGQGGRVDQPGELGAAVPRPQRVGHSRTMPRGSR